MSQSVEHDGPQAPMRLRPEAEEVFGDLWAALFGPGRLAGGGVVGASAGPQEGASTVSCGLALAGRMARRAALSDAAVTAEQKTTWETLRYDADLEQELLDDLMRTLSLNSGAAE